MNTTPIEFMAWREVPNKQLCKMIYSNKFLTLSRFFDKTEKIDAKYYIMQLTALRSINDEPIYNHMIVKSEYGRIYCVDMFEYTLMHALSYCKLQIVGNRFQYPELLELCK